MDNVKQLLIEFLDSEFLVYALYVYLFALVFYIVYCALNYFKYYSRMQKTIQTLYSRMSEQEKARAQAERQERDIHGAGGKHDILARIDTELAYSGIKEKFRWMTTEIYLMIVAIAVAIVTTAVVVTSGLWWGLFAGLLTYLSLRLTVSLMVASRNKKTESIMLQFMNIVDNFSKTSDDLISILEKSSRYIDEPLSSQIYDAVIEARNTGDTLTALQELQDKVKNKHFKVLIRNLEISSRFETNYSDIVEDCRDIFHNYLKSEKEKRSLRVSGLIEILTMGLCGVFCVFTLGDMTESGNLITSLLNGGILGIVILVYLCCAVLLSLYIAVFKILKDDR